MWILKLWKVKHGNKDHNEKLNGKADAHVPVKNTGSYLSCKYAQNVQCSKYTCNFKFIDSKENNMQINQT